jgi:hypothetical protein
VSVPALEAEQGSFEKLNDNMVVVKPGDDLQSKVDKVPAGGFLMPTDVIDVASSGTARIEKPISIVSGVGEQGGKNLTGPYFDNSGAGTIDSPVFTIDAPGTDDFSTSGPQNVRFDGVGIKHHGANSPAIKQVGAPNMRFTNSTIDLGDTGIIGMELTGDGAFGTIISNSRILRPASEGVGVKDTTSSGGNKTMRQTSILRSGDVSPVLGAQLREDWTLMNCDCDCTSAFNILGSNVHMYATRLENGGGIELGPTNPDVANADPASTLARATYIEDVIAGGSVTEPAIIFDDSSHSDVKLHFDISDCNGGSNNVKWTANSSNDSVRVVPRLLETVTWDIDVNASDATVDSIGNAKFTDAGRSVIAQPVEGMSIYNTDDGNLNIYDGQDWILPDGTVT